MEQARGFMSNYKDYFKETQDWETLEYDWGFVTYEISNDCVFIHHAYVDKKNRDNGVGKKLMFEIAKVAKEFDKPMLRCAIDTRSKNHNHNLLRYLHNGAKVWSLDHPFIYIYLTLDDVYKNSKYRDLK